MADKFKLEQVCLHFQWQIPDNFHQSTQNEILKN